MLELESVIAGQWCSESLKLRTIVAWVKYFLYLFFKCRISINAGQELKHKKAWRDSCLHDIWQDGGSDYEL